MTEQLTARHDAPAHDTHARLGMPRDERRDDAPAPAEATRARAASRRIDCSATASASTWSTGRGW